jgi:protease I
LAGAAFVEAPMVVGGAAVTSHGWPNLPQFTPAFLEVLAGK